ncbi:hypothetical protein GDO81_013662 [Engystomops pustulosus]|uniref:Uncharacterized protein n=1 Tax=Engystomops pustulosus TaxID=76066 RepID=A0AAV7B4Q3_ENGPU|nr:hypothetical protein GDO81_013662 [Engystomops pustulosus]
MELQDLSYATAWEKEWDKRFTPDEWLAAFEMCHKVLISGREQETNFQLLSRLYWVPTKLHSVYRISVYQKLTLLGLYFDSSAYPNSEAVEKPLSPSDNRLVWGTEAST